MKKFAKKNQHFSEVTIFFIFGIFIPRLMIMMIRISVLTCHDRLANNIRIRLPFGRV